MLRWWRNVFRVYFTFDARERRGIMVLIGLALLSLLITPLYRIFHREQPHDFDQFKAAIDSFEASLKKSKLTADADSFSGFVDFDRDPVTANASGIPEVFNFDPNTATKEELFRLGLSPRAVNAIISYRSKGGSFRRKEDLQKIYGVTKQDYLRLEPFISIEQVSDEYSRAVTSGKESSPQVVVEATVDLNKADSLELISLPGIGQVLSSRIIKYRTRLGGFYSVEQLKEVYGLKPETYDVVKTRVSVNPTDIEKVAINSAGVEELKKHPYFRDIAVPVISYRDQHGAYRSPADLENIDVITAEMLKKIAPYLDF